MFDLQHEVTLTLADACRHRISRYTSKVISPQTGYRWVNRGVLAADGSRVRLEAVKVGWEFLTTESAVERFFEDLAQRSGVRPPCDLADSARTEAELNAAGLMSRNPAQDSLA